MGKLGTYIIIMCGLSLLFYFMGIITPQESVTSNLLDMALNPQEFEISSLIDFITASITALSIGGAVLVGLVTGNRELAALSGLATFILSLGYDFFLVFNKFASVTPISGVFAVLIFSPFFILWFITAVEWWRGMTT
jgi:hypothetical protein